MQVFAAEDVPEAQEMVTRMKLQQSLQASQAAHEKQQQAMAEAFARAQRAENAAAAAEAASAQQQKELNEAIAAMQRYKQERDKAMAAAEATARREAEDKERTSLKGHHVDLERQLIKGKDKVRRAWQLTVLFLIVYDFPAREHEGSSIFQPILSEKFSVTTVVIPSR